MSRLPKGSNTRLHFTEIDIRYCEIPQEKNEAFLSVKPLPVDLFYLQAVDLDYHKWY